MSNPISNNVFLQKSKEKYNPDVNQKKSTLEKTRKENVFKKNTVVYNSITNQIPENIKSHKMKKAYKFDILEIRKLSS